MNTLCPHVKSASESYDIHAIDEENETQKFEGTFPTFQERGRARM